MNEAFEKRTSFNFIKALAIIYSLLLAVGLYYAVTAVTTISINNTSKLVANLFFLGICIFVLMRFFFAPSKNIKSIII